MAATSERKHAIPPFMIVDVPVSFNLPITDTTIDLRFLGYIASQCAALNGGCIGMVVMDDNNDNNNGW
jgi:hypothetical protein